jgi:hypothetical protein
MTRDEAVIKVMKIVADIIDRKGIGDEFVMIDEETQNEMIKKWVDILME